jgi:hypothetical protein
MPNYLQLGAQSFSLIRNRQIEFAGEIQVDKAELDKLCQDLRRDQSHSSGEEFYSLLTVVVVNLAYYSPDSLREYILTKVVGQQAQGLLDSFVGAPVEQLLKRYFGIEPREWPYRYVTLIKQQSGIPASAENQFVSSFCALLRWHGYDFSEAGYQKFLNGVSSATLDDFLQSDIGRRFCRDLARMLHNHDRYDWFDLGQRLHRTVLRPD